MNIPSNRVLQPAAEAAAPAGKKTLAASRLRKHADYQRAYAGARKRQSSSMSWFLALQPEAEQSRARVGLTVPKAIGKAHDRNRIKRRMREVLRRHLDRLPAHTDLILHPRRSVLDLEFTKLEAEVVRILTQATSEAFRMAAPEPRKPAS